MQKWFRETIFKNRKIERTKCEKFKKRKWRVTYWVYQTSFLAKFHERNIFDRILGHSSTCDPGEERCTTPMSAKVSTEASHKQFAAKYNTTPHQHADLRKRNVP